MKISLKIIGAVLFLLSTFGIEQAQAHARFVSPIPRDLNAGNKSGPCGVTAKPAIAPHTFAPGQTIPIQIIETINHPGKFLVNFSAVGQTNFQQYQLAVIPDNAVGPVPHLFNANVTLPNITCTNCTIQVIQSMEENPNNPTFYYSCADVNLVAAGTPPPPPPAPAPPPPPIDDPPVDTLGLGDEAATKPGFGGGCGTIAAAFAAGGTNGPSGGLTAAVLLLPFMFLIYLRRNVYVLAKRSRIVRLR